jgi:hypothetical protein
VTIEVKDGLAGCFDASWMGRMMFLKQGCWYYINKKELILAALHHTLSY